MGAITTLFVATSDQHSKDRQADEDFRRNHQQVAYADFEAVAANAKSAVTGLANNMLFNPVFEASLKENMGNSLLQIQGFVTTLTDKAAVVKIVASEPTLDKMIKWVAKLQEAIIAVSSAIISQEGQILGVDKPKIQIVLDKMIELSKIESEFLDSARHDVNAYG